MPDEAIIKIVLQPEPSKTSSPQLSAREEYRQREEAKALSRGEAMPWAPPSQPIQAPAMVGMRPDQAEYIRLETEAARRGLSVHKYRQEELKAIAAGTTVPPPGSQPTPTAPPAPPEPPKPSARDQHAARQAERRAALEAARAATPAPTTPATSAPIPPPAPAPATAPAPPQATSAPAFDPVEAARKRLEREKQLAAVDAEYAKLNPPKPTPPPATFDPVEAARKRVERENQMAAVEAEYAKLKPPKQPAPPPTFDPVEAARKRVEREEQQAAVEAEYAKLRPPKATAAFDPLDEAKKRLEREKQRAAIDAEYDKLNPPEPAKPPPPFDPTDAARRQRESEKQRTLVEEEYERMYGGKDKETAVDAVLKIVEPLRGTIGGIFGTAVGGALDVVSLVRRAQVDANNEKRHAQLIAEAKGSGIPAVPSGPSNTPNASAADGAASSAATAAPAAASASSEAMSGLGEAAMSVGSKLPMLAAAVAVATIGIKIFTQVLDELNRAAEKYSEYSPEIAHAQAIAEVRQITGDIRRAQEVSGEMAKYIMAQSDIQQKYEDIKVKLMAQILPIVTEILETVSELMPSGESIAVAIKMLISPLLAIPGAVDAMTASMNDSMRPIPMDPTELILKEGLVTKDIPGAPR